ncbi:TRAP transporter small permease [Hydrogenophaga sp. 5NK40-0174]|uniref:TRAP transporter small permease n=1 Tax=Hydrogenophaga sp. 5NK40-0174 TaxID=3127649 RepID=UPI00310B00B6
MLDKIINGYCRLLSLIMVLCLVVMVVLVFSNVVLRYAFDSGIVIAEEISRWLFMWVVFLGATVAWRDRSHMGTDMLVARLPRPLHRLVLIAGHGLMLYATWLMFSGSWMQVQLNWDVEAPVSGYSQAWADGSGLVFAVSCGLLLVLDIVRLMTGQLDPEALHNPAGLEPTEADLAAHENRN